MATRSERARLNQDLREGCFSGVWKAGDMMPALGELKARYGLFNGVVHQEIQKLVGEGVLRSVPRVGTFVAGAGGEEGRTGNLVSNSIVHRGLFSRRGAHGGRAPSGSYDGGYCGTSEMRGATPSCCITTS